MVCSGKMISEFIIPLLCHFTKGEENGQEGQEEVKGQGQGSRSRVKVKVKRTRKICDRNTLQFPGLTSLQQSEYG